MQLVPNCKTLEGFHEGAMSSDSKADIAKALSDAETAKRRATLALKAAHEALRLSLSTPRIGAMLKEIETELGEK